MAEIEPASDEDLQNIAFALSYGHAIKPDFVRRILARLRKAEAELARLKAAIDEADKHAPEAVHFIRAMAGTQGGRNG